jgi:peptidoglycan/LPS O-acetylase OafA/YrhL
VIAPLTGVRAFAALWVVFYHLRAAVQGVWPGATWLHGLLDFGYLGVDLFGFLSGFVISYNYADRLSAWNRSVGLRYLWLRAVRIFPLHWFTLGAMLVARIALPGFGDSGIDQGRYGAGDFVQNLLMVHGWGVADRYTWNSPSWTVSAEWLCYLGFPFVAPWLARLRDGAIAAVLVGFSIGLTVTALRALGYPQFDATLHWGALRIAGEFLAGCFLFRAWMLGWARRAPWGWIALAAFAAAAAMTAAGEAVPIVLAFAILVYALAHDRGPLSWLLGTRVAIFLGEASYSIYLTHWVVLRVLAHLRFDRFAETAWGGLGTLAAYVAIILATAIATYLTVEAPSRRALRRWLAPPPVAPAPATRSA